MPAHRSRHAHQAACRSSRRRFLQSLGAALGASALSSLLAACAPAEAEPAAPLEIVREVEVTRVVERVVEVVKVVPQDTAVPVPTATEEVGMILYVDIEHPDALADTTRQADFDRVRRQRTQVCEMASGLPAESILYTELTQAVIDQKQVRALAISGNTSDWEAYDFKTFEPLFEIVRSGRVPTIGFCGGHQLIGLMYGAKCDAIRPLKPGEVDPGGFAPGWFKEVGYMPIEIIQNDPLFLGLPAAPIFFESHYWEIKEVPDGFDLLASSENVRVQVIKHQQHLVYGTQFHPEVNSAEHRDGFTLLKNFFKMALAAA